MNPNPHDHRLPVVVFIVAVAGFEPTSTVVSLTYTRPKVRGFTIKLHSQKYYASSSLRLPEGANFAGNRERKTFITTHNITENKSTKKKTNTSTKAAEMRNLTIHFTSQSIWVREQESNLRQRQTTALCYLYTIPPF